MEEELEPSVALNVDELPRQINGLGLGEAVAMRGEQTQLYRAGIDPIRGAFTYDGMVDRQEIRVEDDVRQVINETEMLRALYDTNVLWGNAGLTELRPYATRCERMIDVVEEMANLNKINQEAKVELIQKIREIV